MYSPQWWGLLGGFEPTRGSLPTLEQLALAGIRLPIG